MSRNANITFPNHRSTIGACARQPDDNPTIGIILCKDKDETLVKYSVLNEARQIFASKYKLILPTEEKLIEAIDKNL